MEFGSRGISPLAATAILIVVSVALGAAVMSWGETYIEGHAEFVQGVQETPTSCNLVSFSIVSVGGVSQFCLDGNVLKGLLDNGPDADVADFHARVIAEKGIFVQESLLSQPLVRNSASHIEFSIGDLGSVSQVKLTPKIVSSGKNVACAGKAMIVENIQSC